MKATLLLLLLTFGITNHAFAQTKHKPILYDNFTGTAPVKNTKPGSGNFTASGYKWQHRIITYFFTNGTPDIPADGGHQSVRDAFKFWSDQTDLAFLEVCTAAQADIKILWVRGPHGDDTNFDGPDGILAHAGLPPPYPNFGNLHFDEDETWTTIWDGLAKTDSEKS